MKREQFNEWLQRHGRAFPGLNAWIKSNGGQEIAGVWYGVLRLTDFDAACRATERMLGDSEIVNSNYTSHPAMVKEICSGATFAKRQFQSGCVCKGSGYVEVLNDRVFRTPDGNIIKADTVTVLCMCDVGEDIREHQGGQRKGGGEHSKMCQLDRTMRVYGVKYEQEPALSSQTVSDPFQDLPARQPELYEGRGIPE